MFENLDNKTLERVAGALTGKPVFVRRIVPARAGAVGMACKNASGAFFVDLHPDLRGRQLVETFLHECAHIAKNHVTAPSPLATAKGASVPLMAGIHHGNIDEFWRREAEADALAAEWLAWVKARSGDLESLKYWPVDIDAIVKAAVREVIDNVKRR